jgi:hypothetical protein
MYRQPSDDMHSLLAVEGQLLELISEGAPLPKVLDKICAALDVQLGNVVSLVLLPDDEEHTLHTFAHNAVAFGLTPFNCTPIVSAEEEFLGTLETYCCFLRSPSPTDSELIQRAVQLAALAIQQYNHDVDTEVCSLDCLGATGRPRCEGPPSTN